jgi:glutaconate CoA-transferase subunit B
VAREDVVEATGWEIRFAEQLETTPVPDENELSILRELKARTERAHSGQQE